MPDTAKVSGARHEFADKSKVRAYLAASKHELVRAGKGLAKTLLGIKRAKPKLRSRYTPFQAKRLVLSENLGLVDGGLSWFYTAFERGDADPLTNFLLRYIEENIEKDAPILLTGCGTGVMVFHLADVGFTDIDGIDLLDDCITIANKLRERFGYSGTRFWTSDGFKPDLKRQYQVITAAHWVFSAWAGNYGNGSRSNPRDPEVRKNLFRDLLGAYRDYLLVGGVFIVEITDAVADYRDPFDHSIGERSTDIYPVRQSPEQVAQACAEMGFEVVDKRLCVSYGHQPRTSYVLRRMS